MDYLEIQVLSREELKNFDNNCKRTLLICVYNNRSDIEDMINRLEDKEYNIIGFTFDDVESDEPNCMTYRNAMDMSWFINKYIDRAELLIISCDGGACRSPAIAAAIMIKLGLDDMVIWRNGRFVPNIHVFKTTLLGLFNWSMPDIDIKSREEINLAVWKELNDI